MASIVEYDFEPFLKKMLPPLDPSVSGDPSLATSFGVGGFRGDLKHRTIVCRHFLLGLCQNGYSCGYLHRLDKKKMPACKHGNLCKIKNCLLKHTDEKEISECVFYRQGFCYNGPNCVRRHLKRVPDECPHEASFDQALSASILANASNVAHNVLLKKKKSNQPNDNYKVSLCNHWLLDGVCHFNEDCHFAHGEEEINDSFQSNEALNDVDVYDPTRNRMDAPLKLPYPLASTRLAYFVFQAPDLRSLAVSKRRGVWSVPSRLCEEVNAAFRAHDHVIIYFLVRALKGMYGVARMGGPIPQGHLSQMTPEFPVIWMRTQRIGMKTMAQMKVGSTGMFVGRTTTDCRFENKVGSEMLHISYRKPEWQWDTEVEAAEKSMAKEGPAPPPDALFSMDWLERIMAPSGGRGAQAAAAPKDFYTLDSPGFIFSAPASVIEEMFARSLFGLPANMQGAPVNPGAPLFIFDENSAVVLGLFQKAVPTDPLETVDANAFHGLLPLQVRFSIVLEAPPLHIMEPDFMAIFPLGPSFGPIGIKETKMLANVFATRVGAMPMPVKDAFGSKGQLGGAQGAGAGAGSYKPPFKNVEIVYINIKASLYDVKKRVLGTNASAVLAISNEIGGQSRAVRIRMRGIGSGYVEGPSQQELQEPLHFNVCAESEEILARAVAKVQELVNKAKIELERF